MRESYWNRRHLRRLSRRRFLGASTGAAAGTIGLALVGCGQDDDDDDDQVPAGETPSATPSVDSTPAPQPGGIARFSSSNATYDTFDHSRSRFTPVASIVGLTMQRAVQWDSFAEGKLGGAFAESWEQPDGQTVILKLRPNNFFHDKPPVNGRATSPEDIKFHIDRNKAGKLQDGTDDPNFYRKTDYQIVESVEVTDASTVRVNLVHPSPLFLNLLAQSYEGIGAPEAITLYEKDYATFNKDMIIGTGPFVLTEFSSEGRLSYRRYEKFVGTCYLEGIDYMPLFTDQAAQQAAWEQKQIDAFGPSTIQVLNELRQRFDGQIVDRPGFSANPIIAGSYYGGAPPWNNENLIGAYFRAVDRRQLIQQLHGGRGVISGSIPPSQGAFAITEEELITYPGYLQDRDKEIADARAMWAAGGGPELGEVIMDIPDIFEGVYQAGAIIVAMLNQNLGTNQFKAQLEPYSTISSKVVQRQYGNGRANLWYGWDTEVLDPDPTSFLVSNYSSTSDLNRQFDVVIEGMDDLLARAAVELSIDKRKELTKEVERRLLKAYGAGRMYSHVQISNTLYWNYYKPSEAAPFSSSHLMVNAWIDKNDPTYQGRA